MSISDTIWQRCRRKRGSPKVCYKKFVTRRKNRKTFFSKYLWIKSIPVIFKFIYLRQNTQNFRFDLGLAFWLVFLRFLVVFDLCFVNYLHLIYNRKKYVYESVWCWCVCVSNGCGGCILFFKDQLLCCVPKKIRCNYSSKKYIKKNWTQRLEKLL